MEVTIRKSELKDIGDDKNELSAVIDGMLEEPFTLFFRVGGVYKDKFCTERADAFLVAILPHLMAHSSKENPTKVYTELPISEKLYYNLTEIYMPALANFTDMYHRIELHTDISNEKIENEGAVGTGISGGVDSFYTCVTHVGHKCRNYALTHGVYINFNAANNFDGDIFTRNDPEIICREYGIEYLYLESNFLSLYGKVTDVTNIFMVTSVALALQKLFNIYLISGAYDFSHFAWDAHNASNFDIVSVNCLGTENLNFVLTGCDRKRVDKVKRIADDPVVKKHLFICSTPINGKNCSRCAKCTQTMLEYYVNGDREKTRQLFSWKYFDRNPAYYWGYIFRKGKEEHYDWPELQRRARRNGMKVPVTGYLAGFAKFAKNGFKRVTKAGLDYRP